MQLKTQDLESQIKTLEMLLANYEIQHVVGEIDEEIYQREVNLLANGLETAKHELGIIKEAANQLCTPAPASVTEPSSPEESEATAAVQDQPAENVPIAPAEVEVAAAPDVVAEPVTAEPVAAEPVATETTAAETATTETATTETCPQEPVATIEEAAAVPEQPSVENVEVVPAETPTAAEETPQEPVVTMEEAVPEQPSAESVDAVPADAPQIVENAPQAIEDTPLEAHPRKAPLEAQQEAVVEPIAEQTESGEETVPAEETAAESAENQEEA
jgi:nicotinate-nucleotide--dimethylbenzimidazole phosphoribosyltransferase